MNAMPGTAVGWALSALIAATGGAGCGGPGGDPAVPAPVAVRVMRPVVRDLQTRIPYLGTVRPDREVRVVAQVQGTLAQMPVPEGGAVRTGELLARVDAPELQAVVDRLEAERDYWRDRHAADRRLVAAQALAADQERNSGRAWRGAEAALAEAEARLARARDLAPFGGRVLQWLAEPGQHVLPGTPLLVVGDESTRIHVEVVEEDLARGVRVGVPALVHGPDGQTHAAHVATVAAMASGPARTFRAEVPVPGPVAGAWRRGASVGIDFVAASAPDQWAVPAAAVAEAKGRKVVYLIRQDAALEQEVETGLEADGWVAIIRPDLAAQRVAVSNLSALADGVRVLAVEVEGGSP